jgi:hypothetical protein
MGENTMDLPGFCESGLSISRFDELVPFFGTGGSTRRCLLNLAYLTRQKNSL